LTKTKMSVVMWLNIDWGHSDKTNLQRTLLARPDINQDTKQSEFKTFLAMFYCINMV